MSIYKSYKQGCSVKTLVGDNGVRKTFTALKRKLGRGFVRLKHNRIQLLNSNGAWSYRS